MWSTNVRGKERTGQIVSGARFSTSKYEWKKKYFVAKSLSLKVGEVMNTVHMHSVGTIGLMYWHGFWCQFRPRRPKSIKEFEGLEIW